MVQNSGDSGFRRVIADVIDLCELQWQLLSVDGQEAVRRAVKAGICGAIALVIALASTGGLVLGLGWLLHEQFDWPVSIGILAVSAAGVSIATVTGLIATLLAHKASESMAETKREFAENVRWIKSVAAPKTSARQLVRRESFPMPENRNGYPGSQSQTTATEPRS